MKQFFFSLGVAAVLIFVFWQLLLPEREVVRLVSEDDLVELSGFALEGQSYELKEQPPAAPLAVYELSPPSETLPFGGFRITDALGRDIYLFNERAREWQALDPALEGRLTTTGRFALAPSLEVGAPSFESDIDDMLSEIDMPLTRVDINTLVLLTLEGGERLALSEGRTQRGCGSRVQSPELIARERKAVLAVGGLMQEVTVRIALSLHGPQEGCELLDF